LQKKNEDNLNRIKDQEFELEKERIIQEERSKTNDEIKKELIRQAAAHNNHLAQMLKIQYEELTSLHDKYCLN
jgi:hypothetical protein